MKRTTLVLVTALTILAARTDADPTWDVSTAPSPSGSECDLRGIDVVSAHEAWCVGIHQPPSGENRSLILHYVNGSWEVVPSPNPGPPCTDGNLLWGGNALTDVDVLSANDVWAVGAGCYGMETLIEHWNGSAWSVVPSPNPFPGAHNVLTGVAAISPTNAWAVGYTSEAIGAGTLIEHWNGTQWTEVPSPQPGTGGYLSSVAAVSARDVWAVGGYYDEAEGKWETLIQRWNGFSWNIVPSPNPGMYHGLSGLVVVAPNDVWAVGHQSSGGGVLTLTMHWDGVSWQVVPSPNVDTRSNSSNTLRSVTAVSANSVWAVGMFQNEDTDIHQRRALLMRWDGTSWKLAAMPSPGRSAELNGVMAGPYEEAWCVGRFSEYPVDIYDGHYTLLQPLMMEGSLKEHALTVAPGASRVGVSLGLPSPNPATGRVSLSLHLSARADISLAIFDVRGRMMRTILAGSADAGDHAATWDGMDSRGQQCGPGLYFARLTVGGRVLASRTMTLFR